MTPWQWWWLEKGDEPRGGWQGEHDTRDQAVAEATRKLPFGTKFDVMEARSSEDRRHEESECVPFLRTRGRETLTAGLRPVA